tara:strand:+ start:237 stop:659 length:423 start_codon:yes stop_codon:yes gene_type:complete
MILIFSFVLKCFISILLLLFAVNYISKEKINLIKNNNLSILTLSSVSILSCLYNFSYNTSLLVYLVGLVPVTLVFLLHIFSDNKNKELYLILFSNIILISLNYFFIVLMLNLIYYINSIYFEQINEFFINEDKVENDDVV